MTEFCPHMNIIREAGKEEKARDVASVRDENAELLLQVGN